MSRILVSFDFCLNCYHRILNLILILLLGRLLLGILMFEGGAAGFFEATTFGRILTSFLLFLYVYECLINYPLLQYIYNHEREKYLI